MTQKMTLLLALWPRRAIWDFCPNVEQDICLYFSKQPSASGWCFEPKQCSFWFAFNTTYPTHGSCVGTWFSNFENNMEPKDTCPGIFCSQTIKLCNFSKTTLAFRSQFNILKIALQFSGRRLVMAGQFGWFWPVHRNIWWWRTWHSMVTDEAIKLGHWTIKGYSGAKFIPKNMSLKTALRTMKPMLFGLQSG